MDGGSLASRQHFRWVQRGFSFSGRERHCCYLNLGERGFANVSAVTGLDVPDDGRAMGCTDWDLDGDLDFWVANRSGPQLRFFRNDVPTDYHYLAIRLVGSQCNRDAIGARVELELKDATKTRLVKTLRAGDGYLAQSSKWIHFGLGPSTAIERLIVRWPGGAIEEFNGIEPDARYRINQGTGQAEPFERAQHALSLEPSTRLVGTTSDKARVVLSSPVPLPRLTYSTAGGESCDIKPVSERPILLHLWASWCKPCITELGEMAQNAERLLSHVDVVALSVDGTDEHSGSKQTALDTCKALRLPFPMGFATESMLDKLYLVDQEIFDIHRPLPVPMSILISTRGEMAAVYKGSVSLTQMLQDVATLSGDPDLKRITSLPFAGRWLEPKLRFRLLPLVWELMKAGYLDDGLQLIARYSNWLEEDVEYAKLLALAGYELLERGDTKSAVRHYSAALKVDPTLTVARLNLSAALNRQGMFRDALAQYHEAQRHSPNDPRIDYAAAWLMATAPDDAVRDGAEAVRLATRAARETNFQHAPALDALAAAYAEAGRFDEATATIRTAIQLVKEDGAPELLNQMRGRLRLYEKRSPYREGTDAS